MQADYGLDTSTALPPHSVQLEQNILGCLLSMTEAPVQCLNKLSEGDFYRTAHQVIFRAIKTLFDLNVEPSVVSVPEWLRDNALLDVACGIGYINDLACSAVYTKSTFEYSVESLKDKSLSRKLIDTHYRCLNKAYELTGKEALEEIQADIIGLATDSSQHQDRTLDEILSDALAGIQAAKESSGIVGVRTGFNDVDRVIGGMVPGEMLILGARPNMGKTTLAINIASHIAMKEALPVLFFSIETKDVSIGQRFLKSVGRTENDPVALGKACEQLSKTRLQILDRPLLTLADIRVDVMKALSQFGNIGLVVIDYLQLITHHGYDNNKVQEVSAISKGLKHIAREYNVPLLCLSQLSRAVESRQDKRPISSDLRESGGIEQDADVIMMLYREEYYNKEAKRPGIADVLVTKNRNGATGDIELLFRPSQNVFLSKLL